jgi:hypothetical protein
MPRMTQQQRDRAQQLLSAQVDFLVAEIAGDRFATLVEEEIDHALKDAGELTLNQVVSGEQIKAVARKYATAWQIHGSIPELMGEIAGRVYSHPAHDQNRIGDVIAQKHVAAVAGKVLEMQTLRDRLFERLADNPLAVTWLSGLLHRLVADIRERAEHVPGVSPLLAGGRRAVGTVAPGAVRDLDLRVHELVERAARLLLREAEQARGGATDEAPLFDAVMDAYHDLAAERVSLLRRVISRDDLEDLLVIGYEFWLDFRDTDYLRSLIDEGIDFFFDKYGDFTLRDLLAEIGVGREVMVEEALRFGPPVIAVLRENGMLASYLRRRLEPFFFSEEVLALL